MTMTLRDKVRAVIDDVSMGMDGDSATDAIVEIIRPLIVSAWCAANDALIHADAIATVLTGMGLEDFRPPPPDGN